MKRVCCLVVGLDFCLRLQESQLFVCQMCLILFHFSNIIKKKKNSIDSSVLSTSPPLCVFFPYSCPAIMTDRHKQNYIANIYSKRFFNSMTII